MTDREKIRAKVSDLYNGCFFDTDETGQAEVDLLDALIDYINRTTPTN